jgi:Glyoxalase-like domain
MQIDHVLIATTDLDAATARLHDDHGLEVTGGGRHTGIGTENRIVPLGGGYLEVISVVDAAEAEETPLGRELAARIRSVGEGLMGWVVAVPDVSAEAARTGAELSTIAREGLTATLAGVATAMAQPHLPFFIQRDAGVADPGADGGHGGIDWIEVSGDQDELAGWLGVGAEIPVRVVPGQPAVRAVGFGDGSSYP